MKKITKNCPICFNDFIVNACHQNRYVTCGYKCGGEYRKKPIINNKCKYCGIDFVSKKHPKKPQDFCSKTCSAKSRSKKIKRTCKNCESIFFVIPNILTKSGGGTYCGNQCRLDSWDKMSREKQLPSSYRRNAWKNFEKKCYDCGIQDERILVIHHIDGNRKNGALSNLVPVCHNCHCIRHIELSGNHRLPSFRYKGND